MIIAIHTVSCSSCVLFLSWLGRGGGKKFPPFKKQVLPCLNRRAQKVFGLGQYDGLGKYCGPHTASSVFLILISLRQIVPAAGCGMPINFNLNLFHIVTDIAT